MEILSQYKALLELVLDAVAITRDRVIGEPQISHDERPDILEALDYETAVYAARLHWVEQSLGKAKGGEAVNASIQEDPRRWWALGAIAFGLFMALLDVTVVNVALPAIQKGLHESYTSLEWIVNAYALVVAVLLVTSSRLGDIFGRKKLFGLGMGVFTLGSLLCALSPHIHVGSLSGADVLNISRGIQGIGGSAMLPLSLSLITATFHGRERGTAFGIWGGVAGLATALGPLVGGVLVSKVGWPSIFYLNVPIGILGILLGLWAIHESKDEHHPGSIDVFGLITLTIALFCLVLALMRGNEKGWGSTYILTLFVAGGVSLGAFIIGELKIRYPMLDPRLFKIP